MSESSSWFPILALPLLGPVNTGQQLRLSELQFPSKTDTGD